MTTISSTSSTTTSSTTVLEKSVTDVNNIDEDFYYARDLGYVRADYARVSAVGSLSDTYDSEDIYLVQTQTDGYITLSFMTGDAEESVLDFSEYDEAYEEILKANDYDAYLEYKEAQELAEEQSTDLAYTAPGIAVQVYTTDAYGNEYLIADSTADEGDELRTALDAMLNGEYWGEAGVYYVKVTRDDTVGESDQVDYVMQFSMGEDNLYDYVATESSSSDTTSGTESLLSAEIQAMLYEESTSTDPTVALLSSGLDSSSSSAADILANGFSKLAEIRANRD